MDRQGNTKDCKVASRTLEALLIEWTLIQHSYISVPKDSLEYSTPAEISHTPTIMSAYIQF